MKIAILSLRFAPGHVAHLRAYRQLFMDIGCETRLFLDTQYQNFIDGDRCQFTTQIDDILQWNPDLVFSYNIAKENIRCAKRCKKLSIPFYYMLHEPWDSIKEIMLLGKRIPRRIAANIVNYRICKNAYKVILASENGEKKYRKHMRHCNGNFAVFPLIFCDDYEDDKDVERKYFSFIGGFTQPRACSEFVSFISYSIENSLGIKFCIATRNRIDGYLNTPIIKKAIENGMLKVYAGVPMSTCEINMHYREAIVAWNAYISSTQSGVLPNALMQGTPVLVTDRGDSKETITNMKAGCFISLPHNNDEIFSAYKYILEHNEDMSEEARKTFHQFYEYKVYLDKARSVYEIPLGGERE